MKKEELLNFAKTLKQKAPSLSQAELRVLLAFRARSSQEKWQEIELELKEKFSLNDEQALSLMVQKIQSDKQEQLEPPQESVFNNSLLHQEGITRISSIDSAMDLSPDIEKAFRQRLWATGILCLIIGALIGYFLSKFPL